MDREDRDREAATAYALAELTDAIWMLRVQIRMLWVIVALLATVFICVLLDIF